MHATHLIEIFEMTFSVMFEVSPKHAVLVMIYDCLHGVATRILVRSVFEARFQSMIILRRAYVQGMSLRVLRRATLNWGGN